MYIISLILCLQFFSTQGIQYYHLNDELYEFTCTYDDNCSNEGTVIEVESGYKILITVKSVDLDGENGDFLLVKSGSTIEDGLSGRIFTYFINEEREYLSLTENVLVHFEITPTNPTNYTGFMLTAERYGEEVTTLEPVTTDVPWPTPSEDDYSYITVNISVPQFDNKTISNFQETVAIMATDYVNGIDFQLAEPISSDNVQVNKVTQCPFYWPNTDTCLQFTFALPILLSEESEYYESYQLNETHLRNMWSNASKYFTDSTYDIYELPNHTRTIIIWMSIITSVILLFGISYYISGTECSAYIIKKKKKELREQCQNTSEDNLRSSIASLSPHPLQRVPQLFDSDFLSFYNPDSSSVILRSPGRSDTQDDARDTLDIENLRHFSFNAQNLEGTTDT